MATGLSTIRRGIGYGPLSTISRGILGGLELFVVRCIPCVHIDVLAPALVLTSTAPTLEIAQMLPTLDLAQMAPALALVAMLAGLDVAVVYPALFVEECSCE